MPQPEVTFRHGPCSASIFVNEFQRDEETVNLRSVSFQRSYRDKEGNWQTTASLKVNDLPKAVLVLNKAYEYLTSNVHVETEETAEE